MVLLPRSGDDQPRRQRWSQQTVGQRLLGGAGILIIVLVGLLGQLGNWSRGVTIVVIFVVAAFVWVTVPRAARTLGRRK